MPAMHPVAKGHAMSQESTRTAAYDAAMTVARASLARSAPALALAQLERAHVLGQRDFARHWHVHALMLRAAWDLSDARELRGQLLRLALVPLGHLFRRLPAGNTGRANVSAFVPMDWRGKHWPAFNLADILVVGGAGLLLLASVVPGRERRA